MPFWIGKGSKAALEGAAREQGEATREQEGATREQEGALWGAAAGSLEWIPLPLA